MSLASETKVISISLSKIIYLRFSNGNLRSKSFHRSTEEPRQETNGREGALCLPACPTTSALLNFGKRYEYDDKDRQFLDSSLEDINEFISQISLDIFFPWISAHSFLLQASEG
ncbi:hypothetical protein CEXT_719941 [Caerostris extrusa]|uniref:Uncharacterized protein n=1 Tax=Caerostris extrusa TaxID=172846 RepID=A0AAV4XCC9_CAEEX|nr:hypothetical protein CEXT_719941 [Caerostris extrusa]